MYALRLVVIKDTLGGFFIGYPGRELKPGHQDGMGIRWVTNLTTLTLNF